MSNNGGTAFPVLDYTFEANDCTYKHESKGGMTLRDYFAAKALQGILANQHQFQASDEAMYARDAYTLADAMIAARGDV